MSSDEDDVSVYVSEIDLGDINDEINQLLTSQMPVVKDLHEYFTLPGILSLTIAPFTQGLFHGLGEGIARVFIGDLVGLSPYYALGGRFGYEPEKKPSKLSWIF
jgi:hypothetical protein